MKKWFAVCVLTVLVGVALSAEGCSTPTISRRTGATAKRSSSSTSTTAFTPGSTPTPTSTTPPPTTAAPTTPATVAPTALSMLVEPQAGMTPLYNFMSSARQSLDMTMYELSDPTAEQILIADHKRGVRVRVLLDHDYTGGSVNQSAYTTLSSAGVPVAWSNDSEIFHQKTITVDGAESAIMTGNLTPQYYATTRDFVVMDGQAADVAAIESVFASDWSGAAPSPGPTGVDLVWSPGSEPPLAALIGSAARSVVVENEEMDSTSIEDALESDAERGVDVTVVMTADSEWDSAFAQLESDGVHVVLYPDTSFGSVHSRQSDRRGQHQGLHRLGELLDGQPRLQPRAGPHHLLGERARAAEQHAVQRHLGRAATTPGGHCSAGDDCAHPDGAAGEATLLQQDAPR